MNAIPKIKPRPVYPLPAYHGVLTRMCSGRPWTPRISLLLAGIALGWLLHSLTH